MERGVTDQAAIKRGVIEVDLTAIRENITNMSKGLPAGTGVYAVIKADGYGHGALPIGRALEDMECIRGFAVATAEEALILRQSGIVKPILIIGFCFSEDYRQLIEADIELTVFDEEGIIELNRCAKASNRIVRVHIKVDTGMNRLGIKPDDDGLRMVKAVLDAPNLCLFGVFTHFARADESDKGFTMEQRERFSDFTDRIETKLHYPIPVKHCANSAAIIELPEVGMDAVRAGIALYGIEPSGEVKTESMLRPALSFRSHIVFLKTVEAGTPVGYGGTFCAPRTTTIATIPIGYADGYPRSLSNVGHVLLRGRKDPSKVRLGM
jgi:alanine racemase